MVGWGWLVACQDPATDGVPTTPTEETGRPPRETGPAGGTGHTGAAATATAETAVDPDLELELFPRDRVLQVEIELAPEDWDTLRFEARPLVDDLTGECLSAPFVSPYTELPAVVTIDGLILPDVHLRKKGFVGSMDAVRPSLKVDLDDLVPGRDVSGFDRLTFNNQLQDPSGIRSCLAAEALRMLGVPASRCALAHLTVNGQDLGLYAHVEDVEKGVLPGAALDGGQVYEGSVTDFTDGFVHTFEPETDETDPDLELPLRVVRALEATDASLERELGAVADLPAVYAFWAAEATIAHIDGYSAHRNNFYAVWPKGRGLVLIPTGLEATFGWDPNLPEPPGTPLLQTDATLFWRLQSAPATRAAFLQVLDATLASWDEASLHDEIDRLAGLAAPYVPRAELALHVALLEAFVDGREAAMRADAANLGATREAPPPDPECLTPAGPITLTFDTTFGTLAEPAQRTGTASLTNDDGTFMGGAIAGIVGEVVTLQLEGRDGLRATTVTFQLDASIAGRSPVPVGTTAVFGTYGRNDAQAGGVRSAYLGGGTLVLDAFGTSPGDPVRGSFTGTLSEGSLLVAL